MGNPGALLLLALGVILLVLGFRGNQDNLIAGITGKPYGKSSLR